MESVQERMQRLGTKNKIAYFMAKEKEPIEFKRRYVRIYTLSLHDALPIYPCRGIRQGM